MEYDEDLHFRTTGDQRRIRSRTRFACGRSPGSGDQGRMGGVTCRRRPAGNHDNDRAVAEMKQKLLYSAQEREHLSVDKVPYYFLVLGAPCKKQFPT
ncbi:uncharacterized protein HKW66_Vig0119850 [Vigna angularis]|uniref:Uncharacterized protein n=1 Tax=Phaseolus angularis TaxID=3914 RepID=A0A8T0K031_PHAAN|nr:uncharacterized protein HKW66_Vig0119850 [Vigna angularis]